MSHVVAHHVAQENAENAGVFDHSGAGLGHFNA